MITQTLIQSPLSPRQSAHELLRRRIELMQWRPGEALPSDGKLAEELNISKTSIHRALRELQDEGLIALAPGGRSRVVRSFDDRPRTGTIGLLHFDAGLLTHPVMQQRVAGIEQVLQAHDLRLRIEMGDPKQGRNEQLPSAKSLAESCWEFDGLIVHWCDADFYPLRRASALVPIVISEHETFAPRLAGVRCDYEQAFFLLADALLRQGHRDLARIGLTVSGLGRAQAAGVRMAVRQSAYIDQARERTVAVHRPDVESGREAVERMIEQGTLPTGLICASDDLALGALQALDVAGYRVPDDLSLVTFGGEPPAVELPRPLTAVRADFVEHGRAMARKLLEMIEHEPPADRADWGRTQHLPCRFTAGDSIAPPPKSNRPSSKHSHPDPLYERIAHEAEDRGNPQ